MLCRVLGVDGETGGEASGPTHTYPPSNSPQTQTQPTNAHLNRPTNHKKQICDFGSAMRAAEMAELGDTPYLQSRFYRAPENILGYDPRVRACVCVVGRVV